MGDNTNRIGPEDPNFINTRQEWERRYWTNRFGITIQQLLDAVAAVGNSVKKVEAYLRRNGLL